VPLPPVVSPTEWLRARRALLEKEKALTHARDALSAERRTLPMVELDKRYTFTAPEGSVTLTSLFGPHSQLIIYHLMLDPEWAAACKSCSFVTDSFQGSLAHLGARDVSFATVSRAPIATIEAYRKRMGWTHRWVSSLGADFNYDFGVSFKPGDTHAPGYNYGETPGEGECPGLSVFLRDGERVFHTYSTYARGLDPLIGPYQLLDLTPLGRHEDGLKFPMEWVRRHDEYEQS
jgi:predicted dithiol-disulfide oxidoreductase (DUF899 family)